MSWFILIQFSSRQHFRYSFYLVHEFVPLLRAVHESSCTRRIKEEEEQLEHSVHHRMGVKKEIEKKKGYRHRVRFVCFLFTGVHSLFRYYGLSASFPRVPTVSYTSPPLPANQFNDFIRPLPFRAWNSRWIRGKSKSRILKGKRQVRTIVKM